MNDIVTSPQVSQLKHNRILEPGVRKRCPVPVNKVPRLCADRRLILQPHILFLLFVL